MKWAVWWALASYLLIIAGLCVWPANDLWSASSGQAGDGLVEDIYIARSLRESRTSATEFCRENRTGWAGAVTEDQYTFQSTATRGSDGIMVNTNVQTVGRLHACFGSTSDPAVINFYAEGAFGTVTFNGRGECKTGKQDYPEKGLSATRCFLDLTGLPKGYVGGQLTTNTINSRTPLGEKTDPPGYTQSSIATVRLWRGR